MIFEEHPLVASDIDEIGFFIYQTSGSRDAAIRRLQEIDALRRDVISNPLSGIRLDGRLTGCLVRHGGRDNRLTIIWRPDPEQGSLAPGGGFITCFHALSVWRDRF